MRCNEDTHSSSWRHRDREASGWDQADQRFHQKLINDWVIRLSAACWARPNLSERHRRRQTPDLHRPALPSQNRFVQVSSSRAGSSAGAGVVAARAPLPCPLAASWSPPDLQPLSPGSQPPCWCLSSLRAGDLCCLAWRGAAAVGSAAPGARSGPGYSGHQSRSGRRGGNMGGGCVVIWTLAS